MYNLYNLDGLIDIDELSFQSSDISKLIDVYLLNYPVNKDLVSFTTNDNIYKSTGIYRISYFVSKPDIIYIYGNSDILYYYNEICKLNFNIFKESFNFYVNGLGRHRHFIKSGYLSNLIDSCNRLRETGLVLDIFETDSFELCSSDNRIYSPVFLDLGSYLNDLLSLDTSLTTVELIYLHKLLSFNNFILSSSILLDVDLHLMNLVSILSDIVHFIDGNIDIVLYDINDLSDDLLNLSFNSSKVRICFNPSLMRHYLDSNKVYLNGRQIGCLEGNLLILN